MLCACEEYLLVCLYRWFNKCYIQLKLLKEEQSLIFSETAKYCNNPCYALSSAFHFFLLSVCVCV